MPARVDKDVCLGCGACTGVCPVEAIKIQEDSKAGVDESVCIECGACTGVCPAEAVKL